MALKNLIARIFNIKQTDTIKEKLPQIQMFGYEKSYGAPAPHDFNKMVGNYKSWAYACAQKNGFSVAKCKLRLYKISYDNKEEKEKLVEVANHPFLEVLKNVNPFSNKFELMSITQIFQELTGNAYWWMPKNNLRIPQNIWHLPSNWMKVIPDAENYIAGYVMQVPGKGKLIPFPEDEIVHFKFPSVYSLFYGDGPLFAAAFGIDLNTEIKKWGINFFMNNATPSGVLYTDDSLNAGGYQRLKDEWNRKYRGSENAGKIAILEGGLKYQQTGSTLKDAKFEDISREIRDEILAIFGVPASKLGLVEDVNRANADANDYTYQKETILPRLILIEEKINEKIMPMYDANLICKFDNPVPEDNAFRLQERQTNIQSGYASIDEERAKDGLEPYELPETSVPLIPFNLSPAGQPKPEYNPNQLPPQGAAMKSIIEKKRDAKWEMFAHVTAPQERLFGGVMRRYFEAQHGEVMRNFNKYRATSQIVTKDLSAYILFNMNEANTKLKITSLPNVRNAYVAGLNLGMADTNSTIDFNLFEPNILRAVSNRVNFFSEKINEGTANLIRDELQAGIAKGESINDIAKRIDNIFKFSEDYRSKRIAQTEVIGATNDGQITAYHEAGMEAKEWITARDERVRLSHQIDGQIVDIAQSFQTNMGSHLQYPGDRSSGAPAGDLINCRCTVLPILKKES
jgi:HK97 family phage portal protein